MDPELEAILAYKSSPRIAGATLRNPILKNKQSKRTKLRNVPPPRGMTVIQERIQGLELGSHQRPGFGRLAL